ncbi:MAG TPA: hypothetical protein QGF05_13985 [Dehalococcoidia bacterium]|nr:hypothetical protein [Dehalococcoidia bacterium]
MNSKRAVRVSARCTAILDSVDFPRVTTVTWTEAEQAFVVIYKDHEGDERLKFLGTGPVMAIQACRRERAEVLEPARRRAAKEGFQGFLQVLGAVMPVVGAVIPLVKK